MINAIDILTKFEIRPSLQRVAILDYILKNKFHYTADEIYDELYKSMPTLSRTTVYNTLHLLTDKGAVKALNLENEAVHFDAELCPHAHFICTECKKIHDVMISDDLWKKINLIPQVDEAELQINYRGVCSQCKEINN